MRATLLAVCCVPMLASLAFAVPPVQEEDERRLWQQAQDEEARIDGSRSIYRDAGMESFLAKVIRNLVPADRLQNMPITVVIIRNRSCNAFMFPNGRAYIHTGMLAVLENEAQLATILAHESTHALNRHMVRELRDAKGKTAFTAFVGALSGNLLTPFGQLGALASVQGYSRDLESEADREGFRLLVQAGYHPGEAPRVFQLLQEEARAEGDREPFFFASHPKLQERIDNMNALVKALPPGELKGKVNGEGYLGTFATLLLDNAEMDLKAGRYQRARGGATRYLKTAGDSARAYLVLGESFRQDTGRPDLAKACEHYRKAVALDPACSEAHRLLGLAAFKQHDREQARISLGRYLELSPHAPDRGHIERMLNELQERRP